MPPNPGLLILSSQPLCNTIMYQEDCSPQCPLQAGVNGGHGTGWLAGDTLTAGVLGAAICLFKVVLCFAFYSPAESAFCWVGTGESKRKRW